MTTTTIREQIDAMSDEDRFFAAAYLQHLANEQDEERQTRLESRMNRMDSGKKFTLDQLVDVHQKLESQGL
ncbi:MAG: hypothetical protein RL015_2202 [Verrucomicrobiota bacterium]|jgi:hypothetical protein